MQTITARPDMYSRSRDQKKIAAIPDPGIKAIARGVNAFYGDKQALRDVDIDIPERVVTALIGPSGCGKTTFIRCLNRMNDVIDGFRFSGLIKLDGYDI